MNIFICRNYQGIKLKVIMAKKKLTEYTPEELKKFKAFHLTIIFIISAVIILLLAFAIYRSVVLSLEFELTMVTIVVVMVAPILISLMQIKKINDHIK